MELCIIKYAFMCRCMISPTECFYCLTVFTCLFRIFSEISVVLSQEPLHQLLAKLVCICLNVFVMLNSNVAMKVWISEILEKVETILGVLSAFNICVSPSIGLTNLAKPYHVHYHLSQPDMAGHATRRAPASVQRFALLADVRGNKASSTSVCIKVKKNGILINDYFASFRQNNSGNYCIM